MAERPIGVRWIFEVTFKMWVIVMSGNCRGFGNSWKGDPPSG